MLDWLKDMAGGQAYVTAMLWTLGALAVLLVVLLFIKIVRNLTFGTFVAGGRHRKARLAVMDAAAVDSHRRLVLVRRDDVEHLILIGGPTDVVVEQNIRLTVPARRPAVAEPQHEHAAPPAAEVKPVQPAPAAQQPAAPPAPAQPAAAPVRPLATPAAIRPAPTPLRPVAPSQPKPAPAPPATAAATPAPGGLDDQLRAELEQTLDTKPRSENELPASVEDEMSRLLGELSGTKR